jgi:phosphoglycerate kinase
MRADYNVPLSDEGEISDDLRIKASLETLTYLIDRGCKVVIVSHLGRPDGKKNKDYSLEPVAKHLQKLLKKHVSFVDDCIGDKVVQAVKKAKPGHVVLLENLRFYAEEEANDDTFAKKLATDTGAKYFVQDGFGVVHRAHASTDAITHFLPSVAGLLLEREYVTITGAMKHPEHPFVAVVGGAKVDDKIGLIHEFVKVADHIIIGGAMANTFLAYKGVSMGSSKFEDDQNSTIDELYGAVKHKGGDGSDGFILLPTDVAVAKKINESAKRRSVFVDEILDDDIALDIGDESIERMVHVINNAKTVVWNGTLGYAELPEFAHGSARLALALATQSPTTSIIGGGDTADFVLKWDGQGGKRFTHISTGGGASLELMSGEKLPGIESLLDAYK